MQNYYMESHRDFEEKNEHFEEKKSVIKFFPEDCSWYQSNISDDSMHVHAEIVTLAHLRGKNRVITIRM